MRAGADQDVNPRASAAAAAAAAARRGAGAARKPNIPTARRRMTLTDFVSFAFARAS